MLDDKELKNKILESINDDNIPNLSTSIIAKYQAQNKQKTPWYKKPWPYAIGMPIFATSVILAVILPISLGGNDQTSSYLPVVKPVSLKGKNNEIAFGVVSGVNLIAYQSINSVQPQMKQDLAKDDFEKHVKNLNRYTYTVETMLDNNLDFNPTITKSDLPEYDFKMAININGDELLMYYKEDSLLNPNINNVNNLDESDEDDDLDEPDDEDESEEIDSEDIESDEEEYDDDDDEDKDQEYQIQGIIVNKDQTYNVMGEKEKEKDEFELTLKIEFNESNYIVMEQEIENDGNEKKEAYAYSSYVNNVLSYEDEISFASENNQNVVELELKNSDIVSEFEIKKQNNVLLAEYEIKDTNSGVIEINNYQENENSYYLYKENKLGYSYKIKK